MKTVSVYDVVGQKWYQQNTTGDTPPQLTQFCSVVAAANDTSSFNVYIYGGFDGVNTSHTPSDDVYILSIPSFTWIKAYTGVPLHGRSGHRCVKPYPDQMFVIGGEWEDPGTGCVDGGIIQVSELLLSSGSLAYSRDRYSISIPSNSRIPTIQRSGVNTRFQVQ